MDGNASGPFLERAASFAALALAPTSALAAGEGRAPAKEKALVALDPEVLPLSRLASVESLEPYGVVILCDVPKLADSSARRLAAWVQAGGGAGQRSRPCPPAARCRLLPARPCRRAPRRRGRAGSSCGLRHHRLGERPAALVRQRERPRPVHQHGPHLRIGTGGGEGVRACAR